MVIDYEKLKYANDLLSEIDGNHFQRFISFTYYVVEGKPDQPSIRLYIEDTEHKPIIDDEFPTLDELITKIKEFIKMPRWIPPPEFIAYIKSTRSLINEIEKMIPDYYKTED